MIQPLLLVSAHYLCWVHFSCKSLASCCNGQVVHLSLSLSQPLALLLLISANWQIQTLSHCTWVSDLQSRQPQFRRSLPLQWEALHVEPGWPIDSDELTGWNSKCGSLCRVMRDLLFKCRTDLFYRCRLQSWSVVMRKEKPARQNMCLVKCSSITDSRLCAASIQLQGSGQSRHPIKGNPNATTRRYILTTIIHFVATVCEGRFLSHDLMYKAINNFNMNVKRELDLTRAVKAESEQSLLARSRMLRRSMVSDIWYWCNIWLSSWCWLWSVMYQTSDHYVY